MVNDYNTVNLAFIINHDGVPEIKPNGLKYRTI